MWPGVFAFGICVYPASLNCLHYRYVSTRISYQSLPSLLSGWKPPEVDLKQACYEAAKLQQWQQCWLQYHRSAVNNWTRVLYMYGFDQLPIGILTILLKEYWWLPGVPGAIRGLIPAIAQSQSCCKLAINGWAPIKTRTTPKYRWQ